MGWETWIITTFSRSLAYGTPLLLGMLGEIYAERSGVLNLGVEGMMIMGAYSGFTTAYVTGNPWLGILVAAVVGGVFSLIHAFASVTLKANQVVSGLSLTMLGLGLSGMFGRGWEGKPLPVSIPKDSLLGTNPFRGAEFDCLSSDYPRPLVVVYPLSYANRNHNSLRRRKSCHS